MTQRDEDEANEAQYDDAGFFDAYRELRASGAGVNESLEQPAVWRVLPSLRGADVVDLGCGEGRFARACVAAGAACVVAVDASGRMLEVARGERDHPTISWKHAALEELTLPTGSADVVTSSMTMHYIENFHGLAESIASWLRPGGTFVYSIEHPSQTAAHPDAKTGGQTSYDHEGPRVHEWLGKPLVKFHRTVGTYLTQMMAAGLTVNTVSEPTAEGHGLPTLLVVSATLDAN